jgi:hypothetical protein
MDNNNHSDVLSSVKNETGSASLPSSTAGLYNTLCEGLHLSDKQFQMIQGVLPVQTNASGVYNFVDGIPPVSVSTLYTSNPINGLNGNMQIVISDAKPSFLSKLAQDNYVNPKYWVDGNVAVDPIYAPSFADLYNQVENGSSAYIAFDSETADTNIDSSWAKNTGSAGVGFWGTSSSSVSTELNKRASSSRITVTIAIDKYAYLQVRAGGWFTQGFFTSQYKDPAKWSQGQADWDRVFGPQGSCQNIANQVLLINGYTITTTSYAKYSDSEFKEIVESKDTNVWPFYTSHSNSTVTQTHTHDSEGYITTKIVCKPGSLQIFGMGVIPTKLAIEGPSVSRMI